MTSKQQRPDPQPPVLGPAAENGKRLRVSFPEQPGDQQDCERFEVTIDGERRVLRCHDYGAIYEIPGLYEAVFRDRLRCCSPEVVCGLLAEVLASEHEVPSWLRVLDLGAGNGMVGEQLRELGVGTLVGADLLPEAATAAARDRPGLYDDYLACDLTNLRAWQRSRLTGYRFNALVTVAALGFDDLPPAAFVSAYNLVESGGWIAFNLKEDFLDEDDESGFASLVERMSTDGLIDFRARRRYPHRLSVTGQPLHYVGLVASKKADVPASWLDEASGLTAAY
jgi:predicted TPR repeat methyltransferase